MGRVRRDQSYRMHHITARGNDRQSIYQDPTDRERFYDILARAVQGSPVLCHHDVQMGNHYHLVLEGAATDVARLMGLLNSRYAVTYNARHGCSGHLFGQRYRCSPVADFAGARALVVYVALNPVRAGYVNHPADWPYGSYRAHIGVESPRPHLATVLVDRIFDRGRTLTDACEAALAKRTGGRPSLAALLPARAELTRLHLEQADSIFGYTAEQVAGHYGVSVRTLSRWLAATDPR